MKKTLTKKEVDKIALTYGLGRVKKVTYLKEGWVNYNYDLHTEKGHVIAQFFEKYGPWKKKRIKLAFKTMQALKKKGFPYEMPLPLKNMNKRYVSRIQGRNMWCYKKIEGTHGKDDNITHLKELAKALALFHKYTKDLPFKKERDVLKCAEYIEDLKVMKRIKPKNEVDRIMLKHVDFFIDAVKKIQALNIKTRMRIVHEDFKFDNVLFRGNTLVGIIDIDHMKPNILAKDVAYALRWTCYDRGHPVPRRIKIFFDAYEKILPLSKKEKKVIIPLMINSMVPIFMWLYKGMQKHDAKRVKHVNKVAEEARTLMKYWPKDL